MSPKQPWVHVETHPIPIEFQEAIGGHPLVAHTLYERGYRTVDEALAFLILIFTIHPALLICPTWSGAAIY